MARLITIMLLSALLWQLFLPLPLMVDYAVRYQEYSESLCVNRANPDSQCAGSCQISRILKGESQQQKPALPGFLLLGDWICSSIVIDLPKIEVSRVNSLGLSANFYQPPSLNIAGKPPQN